MVVAEKKCAYYTSWDAWEIMGRIFIVGTYIPIPHLSQ